MTARPFPLAVGTLALVLSLVVLRVLWGAASEYDAAEAAVQRGQTAQAIVHYRRALGWYVPLSPYASRSVSALERMATEARARGDRATVELVERAIQGGLSSARSTYQPDAAALAASRERFTPKGERAKDPHALMSLLAGLGWLGFVAAAVALMLGRGKRAQVVLAMALGFATFCLGLWLA